MSAEEEVQATISGGGSGGRVQNGNDHAEEGKGGEKINIVGGGNRAGMEEGRPDDDDDDDDDDEKEELRLPADTLAHLQSFLAERRLREERFSALATTAEREHEARVTAAAAEQESKRDAGAVSVDPIDMTLFEEDWQMSQFWYDVPTRRALAEEISFKDFGFRTYPVSTPTAGLGEEQKQKFEEINVAIVSAPSAFVQFLSMQRAGEIPPHVRPTLLEYDTRFSVLCPPFHEAPDGQPQIHGPRFIPYDFNNPLQLPPTLQGKFDSVLVDPPFLSAECQAGAAVTVRWLLKPGGKDDPGYPQGRGRRVVVCTGERVSTLCERLYEKEGVRETDWAVVHERGLGNEFRCLASWERGGRWRWVGSSA